ncbi:MAG: alpha/beta hydrolase [Acidimicrobiaceae bacterium]|nr:alpha/beta hydrolase [Acidimicrobiaceae bacterium]MCY4176074.1 alpha/beta hydrolase [Acidimicrobiaceae bacterium]MCY4279733.1 alpha/beta hydrolase [Acidimicrobiaceae bacterium]MCY4293949.1 alpha/beta hydrolase [Acidimicrobiaceae bacterium]
MPAHADLQRRPSEPAEAAGAGAVVTTADGVTLKLRLLGGPASSPANSPAPDLLICHATGFHGLAYTPLAHCFTRDFRVWALDFRGHGGSGESPDGTYSWHGMGADVTACAVAIGSSQLYGFGHSMGGAALLLAEQAAPGAFDGLFMYEPIVLPEEAAATPDNNPLAAGARNRREVFNSRAEALARYSSRPPLGVLRSDALAAYVEAGFVDLPDGRVRLACPAETEARTFEASDTLSPREITQIDVATVVAAGTAGSDTTDPADFAPAVAEALPKGRFVSFEGLGHFGPLEAPAVVARRAIRELLGDSSVS